MSEHTQKTKVEPESKLKKLANYDPYKVFDSRRGCIVAVALCITFILVSVFNGALNGNWLSLVFVPIYLLIIRNRLRKLRAMA